ATGLAVAEEFEPVAGDRLWPVGDRRVGERLAIRGRKGIEMHRSRVPDGRAVKRRNHDHLYSAEAPDVGRRSGVAVLGIDRWEVSLPTPPPVRIEFVQGGLLVLERPLLGLVAGHADNIDRSVGPHDRRGFYPLLIGKLARPEFRDVGPKGEQPPWLIANKKET